MPTVTNGSAAGSSGGGKTSRTISGRVRYCTASHRTSEKVGACSVSSIFLICSGFLVQLLVNIALTFSKLFRLESLSVEVRHHVLGKQAHRVDEVAMTTQAAYL